MTDRQEDGFPQGKLPAKNSGRSELSAYEKRQVELIELWMRSPPSLAVRGYRRAKSAAEWVAHRVLPDRALDAVSRQLDSAAAYAKSFIPDGAIEGAINANFWAAAQWTSQQQVKDALGISDFDELANFDLEKLDEAADTIHNWAVGYGGAAGGVVGAGGILLAVPGVVAVINITMRTIRQIGFCYGYHHDDDIERACLIEIMSLVGGEDQVASVAAARTLRELAVMVKRETFKEMARKAAEGKISKEAFITAIREVAKSLGYQLTRSRLLNAVPVVGGGVGLLLDGNYLRSVGWTARRYYQRRWLQDRGRWPITISGD